MLLKTKGSKVGDWVPVHQNVTLVEGYNEVALLSVTVGLQVPKILQNFNCLKKDHLVERDVI